MILTPPDLVDQIPKTIADYRRLPKGK